MYWLDNPFHRTVSRSADLVNHRAKAPVRQTAPLPVADVIVAVADVIVVVAGVIVGVARDLFRARRGLFHKSPGLLPAKTSLCVEKPHPYQRWGFAQKVFQSVRGSGRMKVAHRFIGGDVASPLTVSP